MVGHFLPTVAGVKVDMTGHWKKDARYGLQFEMESYEEIVGSDKRSIVAYLSSGNDSRDRDVLLAERIYNTFGAQTLEVLIKTLRVSRKCLASARRSARSFARHIWRHRSARKTHQHVGTLQYQRTAGNQAAGAAGIGCAGPSHTVSAMVFEHDQIDFETARPVGPGQRDSAKCAGTAGCRAALTLKLAEHDGHLCMHREAFVRKAANLLHAPQVTWKGVAQRAFEMIQSGRLILYNDYVYRPIMARAEEEVAAEICDMLKRDKMPLHGRPGR